MRIVIDGAGEVGSHIARMLVSEGAEVVVIDNNEERLQVLSSTVDVQVIKGELTSVTALRQAKVERADLFISVGPSMVQEVNIVAAVLAKHLGAQKVIARVQENEMISNDTRTILKRAGIDLTFCPSKIAADEVVDMLKHANTAESLIFGGGKLTIGAFRLSEYSPLLDIRLIDFVKTLSKEEAEEFRIIAIVRGGITIMPKFDTKFRFGDTIYTISTAEGANKIADKIGASDVDVDSVMIFGAGHTGSKVAAQLSDKVSRVKLVEKNRDRCMELAGILPSKVMIVNGDGRNSDFLVEENIGSYDAFVALSGSDESNVLACLAAKKYGVKRTVAEVENMEYMRLAEDMGVDTVINKKLLTAGRVFKLTLGEQARFVRYMSGTAAEVLEYMVAPGSYITKAPLKDINFPKDAVVGGLIRGSEAIIAVGDTRIEAGDKVCVFARPSSVKAVDKLFK